MNYNRALEFFVENGIILNEEQLENLKEASAFTRHMRNAADEYNRYDNAIKELEGRDGDKVNELRKKLEKEQLDSASDYYNAYRSGVSPANYYKNLKDIDKSDGYIKGAYKSAKEDFNRKVSEKNADNTKGRNDHKTAGDYLAMQKAKNALKK